MFSDFAEKLLLAFLEVDAAVHVLEQHIILELNQLPVWAYDEVDGFNADRSKITHALTHFGPTAELSPQSTLSCPGAVACTEQTLVLISVVNQAKQAFKNIITACRTEMQQDVMFFVHDTLARAGFTAIKLKPVLRMIPFIDYHPRRIGWSCVKHSLHKLRSPEALRKDLLAIGQGEHIIIQLEKLNALHSREPLAVHRDIAPVWQLNVASFKQECGRSLFKGRRTSLPLFYLHDATLPLPLVSCSKKIQVRKSRSDKHIEELPYLPSLKAHRIKYFEKVAGTVELSNL